VELDFICIFSIASRHRRIGVKNREGFSMARSVIKVREDDVMVAGEPLQEDVTQCPYDRAASVKSLCVWLADDTIVIVEEPKGMDGLTEFYAVVVGEYTEDTDDEDLDQIEYGFVRAQSMEDAELKVRRAGHSEPFEIHPFEGNPSRVSADFRIE
jgi:hypothetical protein